LQLQPTNEKEGFKMHELIDINITFAVFCFIISIIILTSVTLSEHGREKRSKIFTYIIVTNLVLLTTSTVWFILNGNPGINNLLPLVITECLKASCGPAMLILYTRLIIVILEEKTVLSKHIKNAALIAIVLCFADILSILADSIFFTYGAIDDNNQLTRPDWYLLSYIFTFVCMAINTGILIIKRKYLKERELLTLVIYMLIPALGVVVHMMVEGTPVNMVSITVAIVFYFAIIQNDLSKQAHAMERELDESRISVMMSQIKPHFLHNALSAIVQLCDENPAQAKQAALDFSAYLRGNMESLDNKGLISIEKEMDHVKHYLSLEKAIYGKALSINYVIEADGFWIPPLTIQPIAENAVKHGIGKKEGGGVITISISETADDYQITVTDNGVGYDTNNFPKNKTTHIGTDNVRKRLAMYGGILELSSNPGKGTTAIISLPKDIHDIL